MAGLDDTYGLSISIEVTKNDGDPFYELNQIYYNLDYLKLVQIEKVLINTIVQTAKFGQQLAVALGGDPDLLLDK